MVAATPRRAPARAPSRRGHTQLSGHLEGVAREAMRRVPRGQAVTRALHDEYRRRVRRLPDGHDHAMLTLRSARTRARGSRTAPGGLRQVAQRCAGGTSAWSGSSADVGRAGCLPCATTAASRRAARAFRGAVSAAAELCHRIHLLGSSRSACLKRGGGRPAAIRPASGLPAKVRSAVQHGGGGTAAARRHEQQRRRWRGVSSHGSEGSRGRTCDARVVDFEPEACRSRSPVP